MFCNTSETYPTKSWKLPRKHLNYHDELETTTQDERGMNRLRVNAQIFFLCRNVFQGLFIILSSNDIKFRLIWQIWAKILRTLGKVIPMLSDETQI